MKLKKDISLADYVAAAEIGGHPLKYFDVCDSTNQVALEMGAQGAGSGTIILAERQNKGRGRLGKQWHSAPGSGLYFSIIIRPSLELKELAKITLTTGLALAQAADLLCNTPARLKWPNDLLINSQPNQPEQRTMRSSKRIATNNDLDFNKNSDQDKSNQRTKRDSKRIATNNDRDFNKNGKKCGGVLVEADLNHSRPLLVIGVGVNVYQPQDGFSAAISQRAGALQDFAADKLSRGQVLHTIISKFDNNLLLLEAGGWPEICQKWQQRDATLGQECTWLTATGEIITGVSVGIDDHGQLHIRDEHGHHHAVLSGDVQLKRGNIRQHK